MSDDADRAADLGDIELASALAKRQAVVLHRKDWRVTEYRNGPYMVRRVDDNKWQAILPDGTLGKPTVFAELAFGDCETHAHEAGQIASPTGASGRHPG